MKKTSDCKVGYNTNEELWKHENRLEELGYKKIADCYWTQVWFNESKNWEVELVRAN